MSAISFHQNLTRGNLWTQILRFSLPLIFSNLLQVLFNLADIAVVGRFVGALALGSVGSTATLVTMFTGFLIGLSSGVNVLAALHFGAKDRDNLQKTVHTAALVCLAAGLLLLTAGVCLSGFFLRLLHTKEDLLDEAVLYLRIYSLGMPALGLYNFGNAVFSAVGDTRRPLFYLSMSGVLNVLMNLFFVLVCRLGVAGVALASILAQYLSAVLVLAALFRSRDVYGLTWTALRPDSQRVLDILRIGVPSGLQHVIFQVANSFVQLGVNTFSSTMVAGNSAATNADALVYDVMAAFYTACSSFMGQNFGAGNRDRVRRSYFISLTYSFGFGMALGLLLVVFGRPFLFLFTKNAAVVDAGMKRLTIMGCCYAFSAFMDCTIAASRALGKSLIPTVIVILGSCVFRIIWVYTVFAYYQTISSLYLLYIFSWTITSAAEIVYFIRVYRRTLAS